MNSTHPLKKFLRPDAFPILALITMSLVIGLLTIHDYGESWDEADIYNYSEYALNAYNIVLHSGHLQEFETNLNYYGPSYFMIAALLSRLGTVLVPTWSAVNAWHFIYFLSFQVGVLTLYFLARRWVSAQAAFGTSLLFASQPLFWGHAFINPKDIPFMTFFMASIYLGLKMVDAYISSPLRGGAMAAAGGILGLTTSFRVIGPLAGLLVVVYAFLKSPRKAVLITVPYCFIAAITSYLTWPYLWGAPIARYMEGIEYMSKFPVMPPVLFRGNLYPANELPRSYLPTLLSFQLTEPALILLAAGSVLSFWYFIKNVNKEPFLLFVAWSLIPILGIIGSRSILYDNFRQLFFLLPPIFILAGIALEALFSKINVALWKAAILLAVALPGVWAGIRLHPYEYVYYNTLTGGVRGAFRNFEMDYWAISFREAAYQLNAIAPQNAKIIVFGPVHILREYARTDLLLYDSDEAKKANEEFDYAVLYTRKNLDLRRCRRAEVVASVERDGAVLSWIKRLSPESLCP